MVDYLIYVCVCLMMPSITLFVYIYLMCKAIETHYECERWRTFWFMCWQLSMLPIVVRVAAGALFHFLLLNYGEAVRQMNVVLEVFAHNTALPMWYVYILAFVGSPIAMFLHCAFNYRVWLKLRGLGRKDKPGENKGLGIFN